MGVMEYCNPSLHYSTTPSSFFRVSRAFLSLSYFSGPRHSRAQAHHSQQEGGISRKTGLPHRGQSASVSSVQSSDSAPHQGHLMGSGWGERILSDPGQLKTLTYFFSPLIPMMTSRRGIFFPETFSASSTRPVRAPQQGTSIRATVTDLISFCRK